MVAVKGLLGTLCIISAVVCAALMIFIYTNRRDKGFFGGVFMLSGWWLLDPSAKEKIEPTARGALWGARIAYVVCIVSGLLAYRLKS